MRTSIEQLVMLSDQFCMYTSYKYDSDSKRFKVNAGDSYGKRYVAEAQTLEEAAQTVVNDIKKDVDSIFQ